jgi:hypothetical protein
MKSLIITLVLCVFTALRLFSQDYDIQWLLGDVPVSSMDFRDDSIAFHFIANDDSTTLFKSTANICDKTGNFLFFTNGKSVFDRYGKRMLNGDSLSFNNKNSWAGMDSGAPNDQGVMILPKPGSDHLYYLFHFIPGDTFFSVYGKPILGYPTPSIGYSLPLSLYYSLVDMNANLGLGEVVEKNVRVWRGLACASKMTAVKHANGRDWWIIRHGWRDNKYIKFLLTPDTVLGPYIQNIGPAYEQNNIAIDYYGTSVFNQEGTQMASVNGYSPTVVLDFDRCSGEFSNPLVIQNSLADTTILGGMGLAFSPNGRFLYVNTMYLLNQYDLWSATPNDSVELYKVDSTDWYFMHQQRLGPDGKIYISTYHGGTSHLHVINHPDSLGLACGFTFQGQQCMASNTGNLPNMVNYKLGPAIGSGCDTIAPVTNVEEIIDGEIRVSVFPNPATEKVMVSIKGRYNTMQLVVYNLLGEAVMSSVINQNVELDVSRLSNGTYFLSFKSVDGVASTIKLAVAK